MVVDGGHCELSGVLFNNAYPDLGAGSDYVFTVFAFNS